MSKELNRFTKQYNELDLKHLQNFQDSKAQSDEQIKISVRCPYT
jgi:hypothetical protein